MRKILALCCLLASASAANAAIVGVALGSGPRTDPMPLGPYFVSLLPPDPTGVFSSVWSVPGSPPLTGPVTFDKVMSHRKIGSGWATWSPGYPPTWDKSVYYTGGYTSVSVALPPGTGAFVLYAEQSQFSWHEITAKSGDQTVSQMVHGSSGATGYGFYGTGGTTIEKITVSGPTTNGFAVGEFYGAQIPEPGSVVLIGVALLPVRRR